METANRSSCWSCCRNIAIPLVLNLLSDQIINGDLEAPNAFLMASITNGILGGGMDWSMVFMGAGIAFCLIALEHPEDYMYILGFAYLLVPSRWIFRRSNTCISIHW